MEETYMTRQAEQQVRRTQQAEHRNRLVTKAAVATMIGSVIVFAILLKLQQNQVNKDYALEVAGQKSSIHQFVVEKYLACRKDMNFPWGNECVSRVMTQARAQGAEYKTQVGAAIRDLGLDK